MKQQQLLVSANDAAKLLGIRRDEVSDFLINQLGVKPVLSTATRKFSESKGIRNFRKWSLPQIVKRLEEWDGNADVAKEEHPNRRAFRQPFMKALYNSPKE